MYSNCLDHFVLVRVAVAFIGTERMAFLVVATPSEAVLRRIKLVSKNQEKKLLKINLIVNGKRLTT